MPRLPEYRDHPASLDDEALLRHCRITPGRASGPGGQHRNKVETAVVIRHEPTGVEARAGERRSQAENRRVALFRLRLNLALAERVDRRGPSELWRSRLSGGRISLNPAHHDFPAMLAEALDHIAMHDGDVADAAQALETTTSQLVKLLKQHAPALEQVNVRRRESGQRTLK